MFQDVMNSHGCQWPGGRSTPKTEFPGDAAWTAIRYLACQNSAALVRKWKQQALLGLGLGDAQSVGLAIDVFQRQTHQLATAQSTACCQVQKRKITKIVRGEQSMESSSATTCSHGEARGNCSTQ